MKYSLKLYTLIVVSAALAGCGDGATKSPDAPAGSEQPAAKSAAPDDNASPGDKPTTGNEADTPAALNFQMKNLAGEATDLGTYEGKVVLVVNVASECGLTPQYEQLQAMHAKYADQGLAILGVPCNQFGGQEPGSAEEIQQFCQKNYGVEFDMFSKVDVNGDNACELYQFLTKCDTKPQGAGNVGWNFEKFLINRSGEVIGRFSSQVAPDGAALVEQVEAALAK